MHADAPNFPLKHAEKDMRLALDLGKTSGLPLPVAKSTDMTMLAAMVAGDGSLADADFSATIEAQRVGAHDKAPATALPSMKAGKKMLMEFNKEARTAEYQP